MCMVPIECRNIVVVLPTTCAESGRSGNSSVSSAPHRCCNSIILSSTVCVTKQHEIITMVRQQLSSSTQCLALALLSHLPQAAGVINCFKLYL